MMTLNQMIERLRRRDPNTAFAETELKRTVPDALALLLERVEALEMDREPTRAKAMGRE